MVSCCTSVELGRKKKKKSTVSVEAQARASVLITTQESGISEDYKKEYDQAVQQQYQVRKNIYLRVLKLQSEATESAEIFIPKLPTTASSGI